MGVAFAVVISCLAVLATAVWPVTVSLAVAGGAIVYAAAGRSPRLALAAAIALFCFEGSIKLLLALEPTPLAISPRAAGAAGLDIALLAAVLGVIAASRPAPRALWARLSRGERLVVLALVAWMVLSVAQIAQGGDLVRGLKGFRLVQAYVVVAVAAALVAARDRRWIAEAGLAIGAAVSLYAALRVALGPAGAEQYFATAAGLDNAYADRLFRAVGSTTSAVSLSSVLTPVCVFAALLGYLSPRLRWAAWSVPPLAMIGILGSYGRAPVAAVVVAVVGSLVVLGAVADVSWRRKVVTAAVVAGGLCVLAGGVVVASQASPVLQERARGLIAPIQDASMQDRFGTWRDAVQGVEREPLGRGIGLVGSASASARPDLTTTDNSYLRVLVEQGFAGAALFLLGVLGATWAIARRLLRLDGDARALGVAALAGFAAFLVLSISGEYTELPGKVLAWACLGVAAGVALTGDAGAPRGSFPRLQIDRHVPRRTVIAAIAAIAVLAIATGVVRQSSYRSSADLRPIAVQQTLQPPEFYAALLGRYELRAQLDIAQVQAGTELTDVSVRRRPDRRTLVVVASASTPQRAEDLAAAVVDSLAALTAQRPVPGGALRRVSAPSRPPVSGTVDRVLDALPGAMPGRPSVFWAFVAGLFVVGVGVLAGPRAGAARA